MKKEDLMIGDWVNIQTEKDDEPMYSQVEQLWECEIDAGFQTDYENVYPIPLTPEILEKNGFTKDPGGEELYSADFASFIDVGYGFELFISNDENGEFNGTKKYVHELQHALKLCGIEKEIVL